MTTTFYPESFVEAKSRHIAPAKSMHDFQVGDGFLIKSGDTVVHKLVKELKPPNTVVVADPDGGGVQSISLNPDSPAKDGTEFKYWIDEGDSNMTDFLKEMGVGDDIPVDAFDDDFPVDDELDLGLDSGDELDLGLDAEDELDLGFESENGFSEAKFSTDKGRAIPGHLMSKKQIEKAKKDNAARKKKGLPPKMVTREDVGFESQESFDQDLSSFLGEEGSAAGSQVPDSTTAGGVTPHDDSNDGEDPENTPPPADTIGIQNPGDVQTAAGGPSSNVAGSAPTDQSMTHGDAGGSPTIDGTLPQSGDHTPGTPDKSQGGSGVSEAIASDVDNALGLVVRGADPSMLAPRLLRGAGV